MKAIILELYSLLTLCMEVYPADCPLNLIEADVVKALKAGSTDCSHAVIRD